MKWKPIIGTMILLIVISLVPAVTFFPIGSSKLQKCVNLVRFRSQDVFCDINESFIHYDNITGKQVDMNKTMQIVCDKIQVMENYQECKDIGVTINGKNLDLDKDNFRTWEEKNGKIKAVHADDLDSFCVIDAVTGNVDSCKFDSNGKHMRTP